MRIKQWSGSVTALGLAVLLISALPAVADEPLGEAVAVPEGAITTDQPERTLARRWDYPDNYDQLSIPGKIGSNVRDGSVNLVDSVGQALITTYTVIFMGTAIPKAATFVGDVIGLVDNNVVTKHVLKGILSRHLLRLGAGSRSAPARAAFIHDSQWDIPVGPIDAWVGDRYFRPDVYAHPSVVGGFVGVVVGDIVVRPVGSIVTIFGARETGKRIDNQGLRIVEGGFRLRFP